MNNIEEKSIATHSDIAELFGVKKENLCNYFRRPANEGTRAYEIQQYALSHGYRRTGHGTIVATDELRNITRQQAAKLAAKTKQINSAAKTKIPGSPLSHNEIAAHFGITYGSISPLLHAKNPKEGTRSYQIQQFALQNGWHRDPDGVVRKDTLNNGEYKYIEKRNFPNKDVETERMNALRGQGYTNEEIAQKIGRTSRTVRNRIGEQPEVYTEVSIRLASDIEKLKTEARSERVEKLLRQAEIAVQEAQIADLEDKQNGILIQIAEFKKQMDEMQEHYKNNVINLDEARKKLEQLKAM